MSDNLEDRYISLIRQHEGIIHKVISLHADQQEDRQDLYQEILLQAWKSFGQFSGKAKFSTWLYRIALNTIFTFKKIEHRKRTIEQSALMEKRSDLPKNEIHEQLYYLVRALSPVDRTLITLHLDGYKNREIAEMMGITANHANVKIHRLKKLLIAQLKKEHYGSV